MWNVTAQALAFAAHDEGDLRVCLEPDQAVGDVRSGTFQRSSPDDVGALVEAGLDLDQHDHLLALLGGLDQRAHDRRVAARAVERRLDGQHVGVLGGLLDEALDRGAKRLVRVVQQDVAVPYRGKDVGLVVRIGRGQARRHDGLPGNRLQVGDVEVGDGRQRRQVEHARHLVGIGRLDTQPAHQQAARLRWNRALDLEPDDLAEAAPAQLLLDRHQQVGRLVLFDREVGVARDPEEVVLDDLHAGEQHVEVGGDDLLDYDVRAGRPRPSAAGPAAP